MWFRHSIKTIGNHVLRVIVISLSISIAHSVFAADDLKCTTYNSAVSINANKTNQADDKLISSLLIDSNKMLNRPLDGGKIKFF
jgi:hypothetical protein